MQLVEMHSSWLVLNSIVGCTNACKYCLLQDKDNNICKPTILGTPEETIKELLNFKYYDLLIPVCLFPNTDIFLNEDNINYLLETLNELEKQKVYNDLVIITKCKIPSNVINKLKNMINNGRNIVVYLSYSGLGKDLEPNVSHEDIVENFKNLYKANIPIIHYYRPFLPQNSNATDIKKMFEFVNNYTTVSATMGLMYVPTMLEKQTFWPELNNINLEDLKSAISIWPEDAWNYLYNEYDGQQFFYQTNTCALNTILNRPSHYYGTCECINYNNCDPKQRERCKKAIKVKNKGLLINELNRLLLKLGLDTMNYGYIYHGRIGLELFGIELDVKTLVYLSHMLGVKVYINNAAGINNIYNSTLNGSKPLVLKKSNK